MNNNIISCRIVQANSLDHVSLSPDANEDYKYCNVCNKLLPIDSNYTITCWYSYHYKWTRTCSEICQITATLQNI